MHCTVRVGGWCALNARSAVSLPKRTFGLALRASCSPRPATRVCQNNLLGPPFPCAGKYAPGQQLEPRQAALVAALFSRSRRPSLMQPASTSVTVALILTISLRSKRRLILKLNGLMRVHQRSKPNRLLMTLMTSP